MILYGSAVAVKDGSSMGSEKDKDLRSRSRRSEGDCSSRLGFAAAMKTWRNKGRSKTPGRGFAETDNASFTQSAQRRVFGVRNGTRCLNVRFAVTDLTFRDDGLRDYFAKGILCESFARTDPWPLGYLYGEGSDMIVVTMS